MILQLINPEGVKEGLRYTPINKPEGKKRTRVYYTVTGLKHDSGF